MGNNKIGIVPCYKCGKEVRINRCSDGEFWICINCYCEIYGQAKTPLDYGKADLKTRNEETEETEEETKE